MATKKEKTQEKQKTGYEDTNQQDTYNQIGGDDIPKPVEGTKKKEPEEKKPVNNPPEIQQPKEKVPDTEPEEIPDISDEFSFLNPEEKKEEKKEEKSPEEKKETTPSEEKDVFDIKDLETNLEEEEKQKQEAAKFDWKKMAKTNFEIELEENNPERFVELVKEKIKQASQKVEVDTSKYTEDTRKLIEYLESGGVFEDLLSPLGKIDKYIHETDEETLVLDYYMNNKKLTQEKAEEKIELLREEEKFEDEVNKVRDLLNEFRKQKLDEQINLSSERAAKQRQIIEENKKKELKAMSDVIDDIKTFMGQPLPENIKSFIKKEISTGKLPQANNNARTQIYARLFDLFGDKIIASMRKQIDEAANTGFKAGKEKEQERLHNIPPQDRAPAASEVKQPGMTDPLSAFRNIDQDTVEVE